MATWEIVVPVDPNRTNPNRMQSLCWQARRRLEQQAKEAGRLAWLAAGSPVAAGPVNVRLIVRRARRLDDDNAVAGAKPARDGVFKGRLTPDDSPNWVRIVGIEQECGRQWKGREEVVFVVEEVVPCETSG